MYKRDPTSNDILALPGSEYYDNTIPFEGIYIKYMERLLEVSVHYLFDLFRFHVLHLNKLVGFQG